LQSKTFLLLIFVTETPGSEVSSKRERRRRRRRMREEEEEEEEEEKYLAAYRNDDIYSNDDFQRSSPICESNNPLVIKQQLKNRAQLLAL
jgi:hypothetical protein